METTTTTTTHQAPDNGVALLKRSLGTFLAQDITDQEGQRILLPFLTTNDRLRLSECCRTLLLYRSHLSRVKLRRHPPRSVESGLWKLLLGQRLNHGALEHVHVGHGSLLGILGSACFGCVKILHLSGDAWNLEWAIEGGRLRNLEELDLEMTGWASLQGVVAALGQGACPKLRRLSLREAYAHGDGIDGTGRALEEALESGHLANLQDLDVSCTSPVGFLIPWVSGALKRGACPRLTRLVAGGLIDPIHRHELGRALGAGACASLETLSLRRNTDEEAVEEEEFSDEERAMRETYSDQCYSAIFGALDDGHCPNLRRLDLTMSILGPEAATDLALALMSGNLQQLQALELAQTFNDPKACIAPLRVLDTDYLPNLVFLNLSGNCMDQECGGSLGEAISDGSVSKLQSLCLSDNQLLGDGGVVHVVAGLEAGGCPYLKELEMANVGMGPIGGQALGRAVATGGALRNLERLRVSDNLCLDDRGLVPIFARLQAGGAPQLKELDVCRVGMGEAGSRALSRALGSGMLGSLQILKLAENKRVGSTSMALVVLGLKKCHQLRQIDASRASEEVAAMWGHALFRGMLQGGWPHLRRVHVSGNDWMFELEEAGREFVQAVECGKVPHLEELYLRKTGVSKEVLVRVLGAIDRGACPMLKVLAVDEALVDSKWKCKLSARGVVWSWKD